MIRHAVGLRLVAVAGIDLTEYALTHTCAGDQIQRLVAVAIVATRELGLIAELVEDLDRLD